MCLIGIFEMNLLVTLLSYDRVASVNKSTQPYVAKNRLAVFFNT